MLHNLQAIANEFDSYLQDRAQRLGYRVRSAASAGGAIPTAGRCALVEFATAPAAVGTPDFSARTDMLAYHDACHYLAWADDTGALVQVNICRHQGSDGRTGVRTFAEQFFSGQPARTLPLDAFKAYVGWLATAPRQPQAALLALAIKLPDTRELALVR